MEGPSSLGPHRQAAPSFAQATLPVRAERPSSKAPGGGQLTSTPPHLCGLLLLGTTAARSGAPGGVTSSPPWRNWTPPKLGPLASHPPWCWLGPRRACDKTDPSRSFLRISLPETSNLGPRVAVSKYKEARAGKGHQVLWRRGREVRRGPGSVGALARSSPAFPRPLLPCEGPAQEPS